MKNLYVIGQKFGEPPHPSSLEFLARNMDLVRYCKPNSEVFVM
jgi:hypothetical protein